MAGPVPGVEVVRAGIVSSDVGADVRAAVRELPLRDGRFVVAVRGDGAGGVVVYGGSVDARMLAGVIRQSSNWDPDAVESVWLYACGVSEVFARALDEELGSGVRWTRDMVWFGPGTGGFASMVAGAYVGEGGRLLPVLPPNGRWESTRPDGDGQPEVGPYDLRLPEDQGGLRPDWVHLRAPVVERVAGLDEQEIEDPEQGFEEAVDPLADLMWEFGEEADRIHAEPLPFPGGDELVAGLARPFAGEGGDGWERLAREVGLDVAADDFRAALRSLAELAWDVDSDEGESAAGVLPRMQRLRVLIEASFDDGRPGAAFYDRSLHDLRGLVADLADPMFNPVTGQHGAPQPEEVSDGEVRRWIDRMRVALHLGGVGADLVGGRRGLRVIRLAEQLYGETPDETTFYDLAWLAGQLDLEASNISWVTLTNMMAGFDGRAGRHASPSEMRELVGLAGRAREILGRLDSVQAHADVDAGADGGQRVTPVQALEAMWNADLPWQRMGDRLAELVETARDEPMVEWARGVLAGFEDARSVVVRELAESQARLNAVVLAPFVTRIAERFGGGWREVAAEIGLGAGTGLPADYRQSLENLAELYWDLDPDLSGFDEALLWMRRVRVLIDAGFGGAGEGAAFYAVGLDDLRSLVAGLSGPVFNPQTRQRELRTLRAVGVKEIRRWVELMDLVDDFGGVGRAVGEVGAGLVGGTRLLPVLRLAEELYGKRPEVEMLRGLAWLANQLDPVSANISQTSLARMAADFEGRADEYASPPEVRRLVELAGMVREDLGQVDRDPVGALEAIWNADRRWERTANRLAELERTASNEGDDQTAEWATGLQFDLHEEWSVVVREPAETQARLNAFVLTPFITKIAEGFEDGWSGLAAEVGVGGGAGLPNDARRSLVNLAGLYWEIVPQLSGFDDAPLWMRRIRALIDAASITAAAVLPSTPWALTICGAWWPM